MASLTLLRPNCCFRKKYSGSTFKSAANVGFHPAALSLVPQKCLRSRDSLLLMPQSSREGSSANFAHLTTRTENVNKKKMMSRFEAIALHCSDEDVHQQTAFSDDSLDFPSETSENEDSEPEYSLVASMQTQYSLINVVDIPSTAGNSLAGARLLLLDSSGNIQSIYYKDRLWTDSYWDEFATLIPLLPEGPIGVFGLAGGSAVRIIRKMWPAVHVMAWEIDQIVRCSHLLRSAQVVDIARRHLALEELQQATPEGGTLTVYIGDALSPDASVVGGFAGLIVDLFSNGQVLPELQQASMWESLRLRLAEGGRMMVNCGGYSRPRSTNNSGIEDELDAGEVACRRTLQALSTAFSGEVSVRRTTEADTNVLALTGPICEASAWASMLPEPMKHRPSLWRAYVEGDSL